MKTSVVITAYNLEAFLAEAIQSVLAQTCQPDEVLVVDDCSTDGTAAIAKSFAPRVRYIRMPQNSGGLQTTFEGLKQATGEIVFFLDGDDVWRPEKIASVLPLYQNPEMGIVSHNYIRINDNGRDLNITDDTHRNLNRILSTHPNPERLSEELKDTILAKKGFWGGSAYSVRKKFVDIPRFETWLKGFNRLRFTYLDMVLPTFMLVQYPQLQVGYVDKVLFEYRIHGNNTSGNKIPTIEAAKKALNQGYSTTLATYEMLPESKVYKAHRERHELLIEEYEYLIAIYDNKKLSASKKFFYLARKHWRGKALLKEVQRLLISLFLGPEAFLHLRARYT